MRVVAHLVCLAAIAASADHQAAAVTVDEGGRTSPARDDDLLAKLTAVLEHRNELFIAEVNKMASTLNATLSGRLDGLSATLSAVNETLSGRIDGLNATLSAVNATLSGRISDVSDAVCEMT